MNKAHLLPALHTFEAAARSGSFTGAARALHLTTGAVSQQIKQLEQGLDLTLFERHSRGIRLTSAGAQLYQAVSQGLQQIDACLAQLAWQNTASGEVRLKLTPSFAYKWLVPRLPAFYAAHPDIRVLTFAEGAVLDDRNNDFDLAIDYGRAPYSQGELVLSESLVPVMSPEYADKHDWHSRAMDWGDVVLLHDAMPWLGAARDTEWRYWFDCRGFNDVDSDRGHYFNRTDMAMEAAAAGVGVAMARGALVAEAFAQGRLISPYAPLDADTGYYLLRGAGEQQRGAVGIFMQWLLGQCTDQAAGGP